MRVMHHPRFACANEPARCDRRSGRQSVEHHPSAFQQTKNVQLTGTAVAQSVDDHCHVRALVVLQFKRSVDKRIDIPALHVGFTEFGQGRLDTGSDVMRKIINGVSGLDFTVRDELTSCGFVEFDKSVGASTRV